VIKLEREEKIQKIQSDFDEIRESLNKYLKGERLSEISSFIRNLENDNSLPDWFNEIKNTGRPKKEDPKSLGTMIEKLIKAELGNRYKWKITGSSAMGVDIPEISLNIKSTSNKQPQSSEPYRSAYDRILGSDFDIILAIYDGITFLNQKSSSLDILQLNYLTKSQVADMILCKMAKNLRQIYKEGKITEEIAKIGLKCIVYGKKTHKSTTLLKNTLSRQNLSDVTEIILITEKDLDLNEYPLPTNGNWKQFLNSPLDGQIGISFALQWRYQFRRLLKA